MKMIILISDYFKHINWNPRGGWLIYLLKKNNSYFIREIYPIIRTYLHIPLSITESFIPILRLSNRDLEPSVVTKAMLHHGLWSRD